LLEAQLLLQQSEQHALPQLSECPPPPRTRRSQLAGCTLPQSPRWHTLNVLIRSHATSQHLKPAAALAFNADNYPTSHDKIQNVEDTPYFIDNEFVKSEATQFIELHDPATNNLVTRVPQSTDAELKAAVASAQKAFPGWRDTSVMARQQIMFKFTQGVRDNWDRLAASITLEQGKTFAGMILSSKWGGPYLYIFRCEGRRSPWFTSRRGSMRYSRPNEGGGLGGRKRYGNSELQRTIGSCGCHLPLQ